MADGLLAQLFWRGLDMVDYWITQLRLYIADAICGPLPSIATDQERGPDCKVPAAASRTTG